MFEWDPRKAEVNVRKHRVSFAEASEVFSDPRALTIPDDRHSNDELRMTTIGRILKEDAVIVILTVAHVNRDGTIRIISARSATARERDLYHR
jgi:uncharacterized protein